MAFLDYSGLSHFLDKIKTIFPLKPSSPTSGNIASFNSSGNLADSGKSASDFVASNQGTVNSGKALGIDNTGAVVPVPFSGEDFTGATASSDGVHGYVPAPLTGEQGKFLKGDGTWDNTPYPQTMMGATALSDGAGGLVPTPLTGEQGKFLKGDGTWDDVPDPQTMTGATASAAGAGGLVPAPSAGGNVLFLKGDGTWDNPPGTKLVVVDLDTVTNTSGSYTHSTTVNGITADMKAVKLELGNPEAFLDSIHIVTSTNAITLSCNSVEGTSTVKASLLFIATTNAITSSEFDVLAGRIGTLSSLTTTEKSSLVGAVNELDAEVGDLSNLSTTAKTSLVAATNEIDDQIGNLPKKVLCGTREYSTLKQGGYAGRTTVEITFDSAMPHNFYYASAELSDAYADFTDITCYVFSKTTTGMTVTLVDKTSGSSTVSGAFRWIAVAM